MGFSEFLDASESLDEDRAVFFYIDAADIRNDRFVAGDFVFFIDLWGRFGGRETGEFYAVTDDFDGCSNLMAARMVFYRDVDG